MIFFGLVAKLIFCLFVIIYRLSSTRGLEDVHSDQNHDPERITNITEAINRNLDSYDDRLRPRFGGPPITIHIDMEISSINSISEVNMDYTITMYFRQFWRDERLAYEPHLGNVSFDGRLADKIWVPDTYYVNDKKSFVHDVTVTNRLLRLHYDGSILYGLRITTLASCMMQLQNFPMDEQNCTLEIESYGYTTDDLIYKWRYGEDSIEGIDNIELSQFSLIELRLIEKNYTFSTGSYPRLSLSFRLRRNLGYFILQTYLPCNMIVILSWVSFWINHEASSARVALGITTVLTMTTISTSVRASLPRISYIKAIDIYLVGCFAFVFASLLEYAFVNFVFWKSHKRAAKKKNSNKQSHLRSSQERFSNTVFDQSNPNVALRLSQLGADDNYSEENGKSRSENEEFEMTINHYSSSGTSKRKPTNSLYPGSVNNRRKFSLQSDRRGGQRYKQERGINGSKRGIAYSVRRKASSIRIKLPGDNGVNTIDICARILFPLLFIIFNTCYWIMYLK